jgi:hypothetical protein
MTSGNPGIVSSRCNKLSSKQWRPQKNEKGAKQNKTKQIGAEISDENLVQQQKNSFLSNGNGRLDLTRVAPIQIYKVAPHVALQGCQMTYFFGSFSSALHFFRLFFLDHHLVNRDDRHLLAHAMASDFSVEWQCLSKRTIVFSLRVKLHALAS